MVFWGIEVEPGKPVTHRFDEARGRLHITRATLGAGWSLERSVVQCRIADNPPIFLCSLSPNKNESCQLDIRFEEEDDVVFEVLGVKSVHLAGFYIGNSCTGNGDHFLDKLTKVLSNRDHSTCQDADVRNEIYKMNSKPQHSTGDIEAEVEGRQVIRTTLDSGLVIEDLEMGNLHDGGIVVPGSTVQVYYFGQLKSDGFIFKSNFGKNEPLTFRIPSFDDNLRKGWEVGICGMRSGGRRRITIPPSIRKWSLAHSTWKQRVLDEVSHTVSIRFKKCCSLTRKRSRTHQLYRLQRKKQNAVLGLDTV